MVLSPGNHKFSITVFTVGFQYNKKKISEIFKFSNFDEL